MEERFQVEILSEAAEFLEIMEEKARDKVIYYIHKARITLDKELFKKILGEIWEFKTLFNKKHYRLFAFWDKTKGNNAVVLATHGIIKKSDKIPRSEIEKAERIRELYFKLKNETNGK